MKYWASEPVGDLQIKVSVMICILIIDLQIETCIIWYISIERLCIKYLTELCVV